MRNFFHSLTLIGTDPNFEAWKNKLIQKINTLCYLAFTNIVLAFVALELFNYPYFRTECLIGGILIPTTIVFIYFKKYIGAIYWYFITNFLFNISLNLKMGLDSYSVMYFFPIFISIVQILGRKVLMKQLIIMSFLFLITIITVIVGYHYNIWHLDMSDEVTKNIAFINIFCSFASSIVLLILLVKEYIHQEDQLKSLLREKEILLAEVFHRVKNNMNIVTSLLSLKKNSTDNIEAQLALEECRNRVYSMALVHQNIFNENNQIVLNFRDYIVNLTTEIAKSLGSPDTFQIDIDADDIGLDLTNAVPCGLILNELITNSFKYAQKENQKLIITITLKSKDGFVHLMVKDNGDGMEMNAYEANPTLGIELIKSLSEQINGRHAFENSDGLEYTLVFKQN